MIAGILIIIVSYLFFSLAFFGDKLVLSGSHLEAVIKPGHPKTSANPKLYTFYIGILNALVIFLIPFTKLHFTAAEILLSVLTALTTLLGLYTMFIALEKFEVSRVMPTIGAVQPILILVLTWIFWGFQVISVLNFLAFMLLLFGSIIISVEKKLAITINYLLLTMVSALMFSLVYIFSKMVFLRLPFLPGVVLIGLGTFFFTLVFLFDKGLRSQIFSKKMALDKKTGIIFLFTQSAGGIANILQSLAISLVPISYLAIINSLRGIQYVFLFIITLFFSTFYPKILQEDISQKIIIQKTIAIVVIVFGLAILVLYP